MDLKEYKLPKERKKKLPAYRWQEIIKVIMDKDELQVENGNFTRIINPLIEKLIQIPFKGCELAVALFIIRKTYGYQKKQDEISLTQFQKGLERSRQTIVTALKNLQLVNVARLVKRGSSRKASNLWEINKYIDTWKLVNMARLVKSKRGTSLTKPNKLVKTARHTKEKTKEKTKEIILQAKPANEINKIFTLFRKINPTINYGNKTQRKAVNDLIRELGFEKLVRTAEFAIKVQGEQYAPTITSPLQLKNKLGDLIVFWKKNTNKKITLNL